MKIVKGWRRIDNQRGYINATTGQNLIVTKKQYGEHYIVLLFPRAENNDDEGRKISQKFPTESKAESFLDLSSFEIKNLCVEVSGKRVLEDVNKGAGEEDSPRTVKPIS